MLGREKKRKKSQWQQFKHKKLNYEFTDKYRVCFINCLWGEYKPAGVENLFLGFLHPAPKVFPKQEFGLSK